MLKSVQRVAQKHTRAGITHHFRYAGAVFRIIAVGSAVPARRLWVMRTFSEAGGGVGEKLRAGGTKFSRAMLIPAVNAQHQLYGFQFRLNVFIH